jgi:hypothetical protein
MRFEPRLIRPEEPDDSLELPADLAELAEQLSADADYLAERYPAHTGAQPATSVDRGRRVVRAAAIAVLLTGIGLWGGRLWWSAGRPSRPAPDAVLVVEDSHNRGLANDESAAPAGAALLFRSLSGGEQEGVLDLLEEQSSDEAQVSI